MKYNAPHIYIKSYPDLLEKLDNVDKIISQLNIRRDNGLSSESKKRLKEIIRVSQIYHSNAIEGNMLDLKETELILNGMTINERPLKDELEAKSLSNATEEFTRTNFTIKSVTTS